MERKTQERLAYGRTGAEWFNNNYYRRAAILLASTPTSLPRCSLIRSPRQKGCQLHSPRPGPACLKRIAVPARTSDLIHFGVHKDPLGSFPQFVDEYLCNLAKPSAPEDSDWQAWKSTEGQHAQCGIALQLGRQYRQAGAESIAHVDGYGILCTRLHSGPPNKVSEDHFLLEQTRQQFVRG